MIGHAAEAEQVASEVGVDPGRGLTAEEAAARLIRDGPNELEAGEDLLVVAPFARDILELEPMAPSHWALAVGIASAYLASIELERWVSNRRS